MPDLSKGWRIPGDLKCNPMYINKPIPIEIIEWLNHNAKLIGNLSVFNMHQTNLADAPSFGVRCFKVDCCKCVHITFHKLLVYQQSYILHSLADQDY